MAGRLRFANADEIAGWDQLLSALPSGGEIWQSSEYAALKRHQRYIPRRVCGEDFPPTLVLEKRIPLLGKLWYVPAGPDVSPLPSAAEVGAAEAAGDPAIIATAAFIERLTRLAEFARAHGAFMLKIEPRLPRTPEVLEALHKADYRVAPHVLPHASTIILDISGSESEIIASFSSGTRTKIRRADREGFVVRRVPASDENCRLMYRLLSGTAADKFELRPYSYFRDFWQFFEASGRGQLVFGYADGELVAGMYATFFGKTSAYKDGASLKAKLPVGAMYRLQLEIIRWGKEQGALRHDLIGTPPSDQLQDPSHRLYGVGRYKLGMSKEVTDHVGTFDLALRPVPAKLWLKFVEKIARRYTLATRKDVFY